MEGKKDTEIWILGKNAVSSLNTAKSLREEASIAHNTVDSISKDISSNQSKGLTISKELTQEVLEFIAHQPENAGPMGTTGGQIGYDRARHILEKGGDERAAYLSRFQEANPQYTIQSVNVAGAQSALNSQYETQAQQYRNDGGIQTQHQANTQSVQIQAKAAGLDQEERKSSQGEGSDQSVRTSVQKQLEETDKKIKKSRTNHRSRATPSKCRAYLTDKNLRWNGHKELRIKRGRGDPQYR